MMQWRGSAQAFPWGKVPPVRKLVADEGVPLLKL